MCINSNTMLKLLFSTSAQVLPKPPISLLLNTFINSLNSAKIETRSEILSKYDQLCNEVSSSVTTIESEDKQINSVLSKYISDKNIHKSISDKISELIGKHESVMILLEGAIQEGAYSHVRSIYTHHIKPFQQKLFSSTSFPWSNIIELAQKRQDWIGVRALLLDMIQLGERPLTIDVLNLLLSTTLTIIEQGHNEKQQIIHILTMFDKYHINPDQNTMKMLLSHLATIQDHESLLKFLALSFKYNISIDNELAHYILYHLLQERQMSKLAVDVYDYLLRMDPKKFQRDIIIHEIMLDGTLTAQDLPNSLKIFHQSRQWMASSIEILEPISKHGPSYDTWADLTTRLIHLACVYQEFNKLYRILATFIEHISLKDPDTQVSIPSKMWIKIFTFILSSPNHQDAPLDHLQLWMEKLFTFNEHKFSLDLEMKQAILQLSSKFLLSEKFLQFIEHNDNKIE